MSLIYKTTVTDDFAFIKKIRINTNTAKIYWEAITFDRPFIPTEGVDFRVDVGYTLQNESREDYQDITDDQEAFFRDFFRLEKFFFTSLQFKGFLPVSKKSSLFIEANTIYSNNDRTGINHQIGIGGFYQNYIFTTDFWGAQFYQYTSDNFAKLGTGIQIQAARNLYFKLKGNYLDTRYPLKLIDPNRIPDNFGFKEVTESDGSKSLKPIEQVFGIGLGVAFNSMLGPLQLNVGTTDLSDQFQFGLSLGYWY